MNVDQCLATYGTLAPGKPNHHQLADLDGRWVAGHVTGTLVERGWGAAIGFPALVLAEDGADIQVHIFISSDLPEHWNRLDEFEGSEYRRVRTRVHTAEGPLEAWIYIDSDPTG